jgi:hypothetical protein
MLAIFDELNGGLPVQVVSGGWLSAVVFWL